jgi:hypothetical protein
VALANFCAYSSSLAVGVPKIAFTLRVPVGEADLDGAELVPTVPSGNLPLTGSGR